ncbi:50S ribosomal protein L4 [Candidatus Pacearchaeota archaeon]|nr:50S ribosomal protein L4 [Candidatus Pacearchaeota archaeon]
MKTKIIDLHGKKIREIELPKFFSEKIREDIVAKILEAKKNQQPYAPSLVAGKQHSSSGKIVHRRHVWRSGYGRGISRIPRKILSEKGSQFNWVGAEVSSTRGGRRAHPPKVIAQINTKKINKKEMRIALFSALSATADKNWVASKYSNLTSKDIEELPIIVVSNITSLKTQELISSLRKILGENLFNAGFRKKKIRSGKGKQRGRRYKKNEGLLIVTGENEKISASVFKTQNVKNLSVEDLAKGGLGRLVIYTEQAFKELQNKFSDAIKENSIKKPKNKEK